MTQEHFIDTLKDQLDQKIDDIISTGNINDPIHQSKIRSHSITQSDSNSITHYSLKNNKVLLTLFYDKYNEHSLNFYDNSEALQIQEINELEIKLDNLTKSNEIEPVTTLLEKKKLELSAYIENILPKKNTWNFLKNKHKDTSPNPYIDPKLLVLEEVKCDGNDISNCIENPSVILEKDITNNIIKEIPTEQPPRSETLIDKLPKVILSFLKPIDIIDKNIQYEYIIAEYDGIYSMNEPEKPLAYHNILHFIQETLDKHLEIKEEEKKDHEDKFGHTFDTQINTDIKAEAPLYLDYNIYKCNKCCLYYKEKN